MDPSRSPGDGWHNVQLGGGTLVYSTESGSALQQTQPAHDLYRLLRGVASNFGPNGVKPISGLTSETWCILTTFLL